MNRRRFLASTAALALVPVLPKVADGAPAIVSAAPTMGATSVPLSWVTTDAASGFLVVISTEPSP